MKAKDVIDSYLEDVARRLPRRERSDLLVELRTLIEEGLRDRADSSGRPPDAEMAVDLLRGFGTPADVAARYRPTLLLIAPEDGPVVLRAAVVGLVCILVLGLLVPLFHASGRSVDEVVRSLGQWWLGTLLASLWWPGLLLVCFAGARYLQERRPRPRD